jgi:hypothetical protein
MKKVYEALEKMEGGSEIIAMLKKEVEGRDHAEAAQRIELRDARSELEKYKAIGEIEDLDTMIKSGGKEKSDLEKQLQKLTKQFDGLQQTLANERSEKEKIEKRSKIDRVKADMMPDFQKTFGKLGGALLDNLINSEKIRYDETGSLIIETDKGIFGKSEGFDYIKKEYADSIVPNNAGSKLPPPSKSVDGFDFSRVNEDMSKMSSIELFGLAAKQEAAKL